MPKFLGDRKQKKLFKEWVENSGLPPENVPGFVPEDNQSNGTDSGEKSDFSGLLNQHAVSLRLTWRHVFYLALTAVGLLVTTVTLATVLIMRSC